MICSKSRLPNYAVARRSKWARVSLALKLLPCCGRQNNSLLPRTPTSLSHGNHECMMSCVCVQLLLCQTLVTPWTVARQAPLSMGFSRQENWSGLPFPPPGDLPDPRTEPVPPVSLGRQILYHWATWEAPFRADWVFKSRGNALHTHGHPCFYWMTD